MPLWFLSVFRTLCNQISNNELDMPLWFSCFSFVCVLSELYYELVKSLWFDLFHKILSVCKSEVNWFLPAKVEKSHKRDLPPPPFPPKVSSCMYRMWSLAPGRCFFYDIEHVNGPFIFILGMEKSWKHFWNQGEGPCTCKNAFFSFVRIGRNIKNLSTVPGFYQLSLKWMILLSKWNLLNDMMFVTCSTWILLLQ